MLKKAEVIQLGADRVQYSQAYELQLPSMIQMHLSMVFLVIYMPFAQRLLTTAYSNQWKQQELAVNI
ncbi:hypothetical protein D3C77_463220 [compost metagenome]